MAVRTDANAWYIPTGHQQYLPGKEVANFQVPNDLFVGLTQPIIAHNMKFDWSQSELNGIKVPTGNLRCTLMESVYIDENHIPGHSLETVLKLYLNKEKKIDLASLMRQFGWAKTPPEIMHDYAIQDVNYLPELDDVLLSRMEPQHIKLWEETDREFMLLLADIEMRGIPIDRFLCEELAHKCEARLLEIRRELGFDPAKSSQLHPKLFSDPPIGLGFEVPSRTPKKGDPQVNLDWLASKGHPVTALVYEYRKTQQQLSMYFSAYLKLTTRAYPRLHPNFKQHGQVNGRPSCENPNLSQIPREEYQDAFVKKLFLPEQDKQLWEADYRTIEYRLSAVYARSAKLIELFENEGDFHQLVADDIQREAEIPFSRQQAKTFNYATGYGAGPETVSKKLGLSISTAKRVIDGYRSAYPELRTASNEATEYANQHGEVEFWTGRTRHFRWESEHRKAFNSVIQGGAFEIVKRSLLKLHRAGFQISNQVYDSVWLNVDSEKDVIEAQHIMEDWTKPFFGLSFRTDRKRLN